MATISELNIRLGLLSKDFDRQLSAFEKRMQGVADRMGSIGTTMSLAISAPLAALGAIALKTAAEYESMALAMGNAFESVGLGTQMAASEIEKLRQIALAPGLDFDQAVKGSVRLQGVGLSAEKARLILKELGNQIAATGGSADQLDAVTKQFSQIIGKGRLLQEDLSIILENMPGLARVLKEEFGTTSAEAIRALGVSAEDFIDRITNRMATMPRVAGGLANAFTNASVAIRQSFAVVGEAINKTFNVTGLLNNFSDWIVGLAESFAKLDEGTQAVVLSVGAFVFALGPAIKAMSLIVSGTTSVVGAFSRVAESFRITSAAGTGTIGVFSRMNTAMKLNVFIAATSAILAIAAAFAVYNSRAEEANFGAQVFAEAQQTIAEEVGKETAALNKNIEVLKSTTATTDERAEAINELRRLYPDYLRGVDLEKASLIDLTEIQGRLNNEILQGVAERQKGVAVNKVYEEQAKLLLRIQEIQRTGKVTTSEATLIDTGEMIRAGGVAEAVILKLKAQSESLGKQAKVVGDDFDKAFGIGAKSANKQYDALTRQRQAVEDAKDALEDMTPAQREAAKNVAEFEQRFTKSAAAISAGTSETAKKTKLYADALKSIRAVAEKGDVLGADLFGEQVNEISNQIERLLEGGFKPYGKEVQSLRAMLVTLSKESGKGFASANFAQATIAELDKIENAIGDVNAAFEPIVIDPPLVEPTVEAINKVSDALAKIQSPPPLVFKSTTPEVGDVPTLPSIEIPKQVVSIETGGAIAGLKELQEVALESIETNTSYLATWTQIQEIMALSTEGLNGFSEAMSAAAEMAAAQGDVLGSMALAVGDAVAQAAAQGASSFGELANAAVGAAAKIVRAWIQQGVAAAVAKALSFLPFPFNLAAGAVAGAAAATLFNSAIAAIGIPALAEGGVVSGPTMVMVGEYPGASSNPEIVAPESKLTKIFSGELSKAQSPMFSAISNIAGAVNNIAAPAYFIENKSSQASAVSNTKNSSGDVRNEKHLESAVSAISNIANTANAAFSDFSKKHETNTSDRSDVTQTTVANLASSITNLFGGASIQAKAFSRNSETNDNSKGDTTHTVTIEGDVSSAVTGGNEVNETHVSKAITAISNSVSTLLSTVLPGGVTNLKIPAFATGGVVKTPTFGLLGEYAGAATNPEIIAPEGKLRQIFREEGGDTTLSATIRGDDILFLVDKAAKRRGRIA